MSESQVSEGSALELNQFWDTDPAKPKLFWFSEPRGFRVDRVVLLFSEHGRDGDGGIRGGLS